MTYDIVGEWPPQLPDFYARGRAVLFLKRSEGAADASQFTVNHGGDGTLLVVRKDRLIPTLRMQDEGCVYMDLTWLRGRVRRAVQMPTGR